MNIHYDCEAATGVVSGWFAANAHHANAHHAFVKEAMALALIARCRRVKAQQTHVQSHTGDPFNECADVLAKKSIWGVFKRS